MGGSLRGAKAVVTGASRGLGRWITLALAEAGADVALMARTERTLSEVALEVGRLGVRAPYYPVDLRDVDAARQAVAAAHADLGGIDILVNNAGDTIRAPALTVTPDDFDATMSLNLRAAFFMAQSVGRYMVEQGSGSIINVSSMSGLLVRPGASNSVYGAAKAGVIMLTKWLAAEWARFGVRVNCIAPGRFPTALIDRNPLAGDDELLKFVPMGRTGEPPDITGPVVFLASAASAYITGQTIPVDGGRTVL